MASTDTRAMVIVLVNLGRSPSHTLCLGSWRID
jgi:hypothetical protein